MALVPALAFASGYPFMPHLGPGPVIPPARQVQLPNMYKLAPIPPFMPVIFRNMRKLGITPAQRRALIGSLKGNELLMESAMSTNRTLHEDILNNVTGASLHAAIDAVAKSQDNLLHHSVAADEKIRKILTPAQMTMVVSLYREMESAHQQSSSPTNGVPY